MVLLIHYAKRMLQFAYDEKSLSNDRWMRVTAPKKTFGLCIDLILGCFGAAFRVGAASLWLDIKSTWRCCTPLVEVSFRPRGR